jgi:hypothetical protein
MKVLLLTAGAGGRFDLPLFEDARDASRHVTD